MRRLFRRRFNYLDTAVMAFTIAALMNEHWLLAIGIVLSGSAVSVLGESRYNEGTPK